MTAEEPDLPEGVVTGEQRAIARAITRIENREPGYRDLVGALHRQSTDASVIGVTGSPGAGKSTLVDKLVGAYRDRGESVGVIAIDPSSPFSGGAVLGDRIRMAEAVTDDDVFVRSMSARGTLGGLSSATADAVRVFDAAGMDRIIIETVGAGQNEIDIVRTAGTVLVLVPPQSGDMVQVLKAGILEIADVFVVNKADLDGADRVVEELRELSRIDPELEGGEAWEPPIIETVATAETGIADLIDAIDAHREHLTTTDSGRDQQRRRYREELRTLLREDVGAMIDEELAAQGGMTELVDAIRARETDPYAAVESVTDPIWACLEDDDRP